MQCRLCGLRSNSRFQRYSAQSARGEDRPDSDVDILVQFSLGSKTFKRFLALSELLESNLGRRIEVVTTAALSPFIGPHILAEAQAVIRAE
jgi:uncharacterized protein